jgi:hypothetical protein
MRKPKLSNIENIYPNKKLKNNFIFEFSLTRKVKRIKKPILINRYAAIGRQVSLRMSKV